MRTYTEKELLKAVEYGCSMQKAQDYQDAGHYLVEEFDSLKEADEAIINVLNILSDCDNNQSKNLAIEDINEYIGKL